VVDRSVGADDFQISNGPVAVPGILSCILCGADFGSDHPIAKKSGAENTT